MKLENALIARLCHDLITPFNAISLGLEAFEYTNDLSLLENVKESSSRANSILKLVRDLCGSDDRDFSVSSLKELLSNFLAASKIQSELVSANPTVQSVAGKIAICHAWIARDSLPRGGIVTQHFSPDKINVVCRGNAVNPPQFDAQQVPTSKNAIMLLMLQKGKISAENSDDQSCSWQTEFTPINR